MNTEQLDKLPDGTVINFSIFKAPYALVRSRGWWHGGFLPRLSDQVIEEADPGSIRVMSVPIEALFSDEALADAAHEIWLNDDNWLNAARHGITAAIAHVIGEAPGMKTLPATPDMDCWECLGTGMATLNPDEELGSHICSAPAREAP